MSILEKTPLKSDDWKSWTAHTLKMLAVFLVFTLIINATAGFVIGTLVIYLREKDENGHTYEFWLWKKWDSVLDWFIPQVFLIGAYWLTVLLTTGADFS